MLRRNDDGLLTYQFESLAVKGLVHAVFTRIGGVSHGPFATLNVGHTVGDEPDAVAENHARIYAHLGVSAGRVASPQQVHSNQVAVVSGADAGQVVARTDGLVTDAAGLVLLLRFADCQPILLYDPVNHALGLIHAGWRGVAKAIARRAVEAMEETFGTQPRDLVAGLGPAIGPCCYTVGHKVAAAMGYVLPDWNQVMRPQGDGWRFDLPAANAQLLAAAGVRAIEQAHLCTACHNDEFFSHRADNGLTGRFATVAYLKVRAGDEKRGTIKRRGGDADVEASTVPDSLNPPGFPAFQELSGGVQ